jgi:hypothetical protein
MSDKPKTGKLWSVRGVGPEVQAAARMAADRASMTLGAWVSRALHETAARELTGKAVGPTLDRSVEQLTEQIAEINRRTAEAQSKFEARLKALEQAQAASRGILALFRRKEIT